MIYDAVVEEVENVPLNGVPFYPPYIIEVFTGSGIRRLGSNVDFSGFEAHHGTIAMIAAGCQKHVADRIKSSDPNGCPAKRVRFGIGGGQIHPKARGGVGAVEQHTVVLDECGHIIAVEEIARGREIAVRPGLSHKAGAGSGEQEEEEVFEHNRLFFNKNSCVLGVLQRASGRMCWVRQKKGHPSAVPDAQV